MNWRNRKAVRASADSEQGVVTVEFILLFPLYLLIIVGIVEFGHLLYVRHTLTNASREGARAAVVYAAVSNRVSWAQTTATDTVNKYMQDTKFMAAWKVTFPTTATKTGDPFTVTVTAPSSLLLLDTMVPAFKNLTVSAETTMIME